MAIRKLRLEERLQPNQPFTVVGMDYFVEENMEEQNEKPGIGMGDKPVWDDIVARDEAEASGDLKDLLRSAAELKEQISDKKAALGILQKSYDDITDKILRTMELMGIDKVNAHGFTFYTHTESSVQTPKTTEEKEKFFMWLEAEGIFYEFASVNSQSLNKLYRDKAELAAKEATERGVLDFVFRIPGINPPSTYVDLRMRRGK